MLDAMTTRGKVTASASPEDRTARLVRNLLALRTVLSMEQMQTGRWSERIEELDQELASLGHDMTSTVACATEGLRRTVLLSRLASRRQRGSAHRTAGKDLARKS